MKLKVSLTLMLLVGVGIIALSIFVIPGNLSKIIWSAVGLCIIVIAGIGLIISTLYVKAKGNLAYVKTGSGGLEVIKDKGRIIIGFLHEIIPVSLETMKITVERTGKESLITLDKMRAEVTAEFYIRVKADADQGDGKKLIFGGIQTAARTLGDKIASRRKMDQGSVLAAQTEAVKELEKEKLIDALRTVAAKISLEDLNLKRDEFKKAVMEVVKDGLEQNGLELEDCTISSLDQAPMSVLDPNNSFDAQGLKNLQQIISQASVKTNELKRTAELQIKKQDVETRKAVLDQEQDQKFKEADQAKQIRAYIALQNREGSMAEIASQEEVAKRGIAKDQAIETETVLKTQKVQMAMVEQTKAVQTATIDQQKTTEIADRAKQIAIAEKDAERALVDQKRAEAEAMAEKSRQNIETVKVTETAERQKKKLVIDKQAQIEQSRQEEQMKADVKAYTTEKEADGRKKAAEADYQARVKAAQAEKEAAMSIAEGARATAMVPVEVSQRQVEVDTARVANVLKPELEAKSNHQKVSVELELGKLQIMAQQTIGVEFAKAIGTMTSKADMTIFGDPSTLATMVEKFSKGMGMGKMVEGFLQNPEAVSVIQGLVEKAGGTVSGLVDRILPKKDQAPEKK